jgi:hypothetical protein
MHDVVVSSGIQTDSLFPREDVLVLVTYQEAFRMALPEHRTLNTSLKSTQKYS